MHFAVTDRQDGYDRHIKRIEEVPSLEIPVPGGSDEQNQNRQKY